MEKEIPYTDCTSLNGDICKEKIANTPPTDCTCVVPFNITENWEGQVFMYYGLENFYQNHRRYVKSRDDKQLLGKTANGASTECKPFQNCQGDDCTNGVANNLTKKEGAEIPYLPCGAIANSLFSGKAELNTLAPRQLFFVIICSVYFIYMPLNLLQTK